MHASPNTAAPNKQLETPTSFANFANVTPQSVRNWIRRGIIKPVIQCGKIVRFDRAEALVALNGGLAQ